MESLEPNRVKRCNTCKWSHLDVEAGSHYCTQAEVVNYENDDPRYLAGDADMPLSAIPCIVERSSIISPCGRDGKLYEPRKIEPIGDGPLDRLNEVELEDDDYEENPNAFFDDTAENSGPWSNK